MGFAKVTRWAGSKNKSGGRTAGVEMGMRTDEPFKRYSSWRQNKKHALMFQVEWNVCGPIWRFQIDFKDMHVAQYTGQDHPWNELSGETRFNCVKFSVLGVENAKFEIQLLVVYLSVKNDFDNCFSMPWRNLRVADEPVWPVMARMRWIVRVEFVCNSNDEVHHCQHSRNRYLRPYTP